MEMRVLGSEPVCKCHLYPTSKRVPIGRHSPCHHWSAGALSEVLGLSFLLSIEQAAIVAHGATASTSGLSFTISVYAAPLRPSPTMANRLAALRSRMLLPHFYLNSIHSLPSSSMWSLFFFVIPGFVGACVCGGEWAWDWDWLMRRIVLEREIWTRLLWRWPGAAGCKCLFSTPAQAHHDARAHAADGVTLHTGNLLHSMFWGCQFCFANDNLCFQSKTMDFLTCPLHESIPSMVAVGQLSVVTGLQIIYNLVLELWQRRWRKKCFRMACCSPSKSTASPNQVIPEIRS